MELRVWLVTVGEPLPTDDGDQRLHRTGMLAEVLSQRGHEVTWWTSSFDHFARSQRRVGDVLLRGNEFEYRIVVLASPGYRSNISVSRIWDHTLVAARFAKEAKRRASPDVIVASLPALELCEATKWVAGRFGVPFLVDVRDLWPDIFERSVPPWSRKIIRPAFAPYRLMARRACKGAAGIVGITEPILGWGLANARRSRGPYDSVVPFGYPSGMAEPGDPGDVEFWRGRGVGAGDICAVFLGALTDQFDFEPLIAACKILSRTYPSLKWVVCGRGPLLDDLRRRAASVPAMIVPGWVDRQQMAALFAQSVVALAPYRVLPDFQMSIPNKVPEYLAGGLPIVTSLRNSEVSRLLEVNGCGSVYPEGNATELARQISAILVRAPVEKDAVRRSCLGLYEKEFRADMVYGRYADHIEAVAVGAGAPM